MFFKILFNYQGERTHGECTQGECVVAWRTDPIHFERRETVRAFIVNWLFNWLTVNIDEHVEVVLVQNTVVHVNSGNENDHLGITGQNASTFYQNAPIFSETIILFLSEMIY
jgi:hypothetical protein